MTLDDFLSELILEGWSLQDATDYVADLQEYPEAIQRILLLDPKPAEKSP